MAARDDPTLGYATDVGRGSRHNQDRLGYYIPDDAQLASLGGSIYVVADGLGSAERGAALADLCIRTLVRAYYRAVRELGRAAALARAIAAADRALRQELATSPDVEDAGVTVVAAVVRGDELVVAHVGDPRAYLIREGRAYRLTPDSSGPAYLGRGTLPQPMVSEGITLGPGDRVLLCSDGLHQLVNEQQMAAVVSSRPAKEAAERLVAMANARGGWDNITAVVLDPYATETQPISLPSPGEGRVSWGTVAVGAAAIALAAALLAFQPWRVLGGTSRWRATARQPASTARQPDTAAGPTAVSWLPQVTPVPLITDTPAPTPTEAMPLMPSLIALSAENARQAVRLLGLEIKEIRQYSNDIPPGFVSGQDPDPDVPLRVGDLVTIAISLGPPPPPTATPIRYRRPTWTPTSEASPTWPPSSTPTSPPPAPPEEKRRPTPAPTAVPPTPVPTAIPELPTPLPPLPTVPPLQPLAARRDKVWPAGGKAPSGLAAQAVRWRSMERLEPLAFAAERRRLVAAPLHPSGSVRAQLASVPIPRLGFELRPPGLWWDEVKGWLARWRAQALRVLRGLGLEPISGGRQSAAPRAAANDLTGVMARSGALTRRAAHSTTLRLAATSTIEPTATISATEVITPTDTPTMTPTSTPTWTPTSTPTDTPTPTPTDTPTATPTPTPRPAYLPEAYRDQWLTCDQPWNGIDDPEPNDDPYVLPYGCHLCRGHLYRGRLWRADGQPDRIDYFVFTLRQTGRVRIELRVPAGANYDLALYRYVRQQNPPLEIIRSSRSPTGEDESILADGLEAGRYWLSVWGYDRPQREPYDLSWTTD